MTSITRTMLITSFCYFIVTVSLLVYAITSVMAQGQELATIEQTLVEQAQKKLASEAISTVITRSEDDRKKLTKYFLSDEADVLTLIASVEALATNLGVKLVTNELNIIPATESVPAFLKTGFTVEGSEYGTLNFLKALESLPYHSQIDLVEINRSDIKTSLKVSLSVTVLPSP